MSWYSKMQSKRHLTVLYYWSVTGASSSFLLFLRHVLFIVEQRDYFFIFIL
jgi:hypothetical protein